MVSVPAVDCLGALGGRDPSEGMVQLTCGVGTFMLKYPQTPLKHLRREGFVFIGRKKRTIGRRVVDSPVQSPWVGGNLQRRLKSTT